MHHRDDADFKIKQNLVEPAQTSDRVQKGKVPNLPTAYTVDYKSTYTTPSIEGPTPTVGIKFDQHKPNLALIPKEAMYVMGAALTYGAQKYAADNFKEGMHVRRSLAAALRHIYQFLDGENVDVESNISHLGHALASLAMASYTIENRPDFDDRYQKTKAD